jgi:hypothetical protein
MIHRPVSSSLAGSRARDLLGAVLLGTILCAFMVPAVSADPVILTVAPRILTATDQDTFLIVIPPRPEGEARVDREAAEKARSVEQGRLPEVTDQLAGIKAKVELQKKEIEALKAKIKVADQAKNEAEKLSLQGKQKIEEMWLDLLEKRADMREAEKALTTTAVDASEALVHYYDVELELIAKRATKPPEAQGLQDDAALERKLRHENDLRELERKGLEAFLIQVEKREKMLDAEKKLIERRLELFEAQNAAWKVKGK